METTTQTPDIELTEREKELFDRIHFGSSCLSERRESILPTQALWESLNKRRAIPEIRLRYFTQHELNPGGRGRSRKDIFKENGTTELEIPAHPNFLKFLQYFTCGPNLSSEIRAAFKHAASFSGYLTGSDIVDLTPEARKAVRAGRMNPHSASEEFFKLAIECGATPECADALRKQVRSVKI